MLLLLCVRRESLFEKKICVYHGRVGTSVKTEADYSTRGVPPSSRALLDKRFKFSDRDSSGGHQIRRRSPRPAN